ncbi:hypothetical protein GLOIN_2v1534304 [Rhizophagus clarus]|uniref:Sequence orphan n=1 Tax=Rhizophagus clarus TaxID=94130 RepID=A0A8H3LH59_9GLOM|nr:hypothetical protein GLOIN_2v1534304 [Rhizophagus clarus]
MFPKIIYIIYNILPRLYYFDAIDPEAKRIVTCPLVTEDSSKYLRRSSSSSSDEDESKIQLVEFKCNNATEETCNKVKDTFFLAGKIISKTFILKTPILLSVDYTNLCIVKPELCDLQEGKVVVIGSAQSAREMLFLDDDGLTRYYPQSLVKQYQLKKHPEFATYDIIATFNSIVNWRFPSDYNVPIQPKQFDMLYIVLHELMHGLGFGSNWKNWFLTGNKTPPLITTKPDIVVTSDKQIIFNEFKESAFDRHLIFNSNYNNLTSITVKLNDFAKPGTKFNNVTDLIQSFINSRQSLIAENMNNIFTTFNSLSSYPKSCHSERAILETSIVPFQNGESISHFDQSYINTPDFLMTTIQVPGKTLSDLVRQSGGTSPIGPRLQAIMECLGYETKRNLTPYRPKLVSSL